MVCKALLITLRLLATKVSECQNFQRSDLSIQTFRMKLSFTNNPHLGEKPKHCHQVPSNVRVTWKLFQPRSCDLLILNEITIPAVSREGDRSLQEPSNYHYFVYVTR